MRKLALIFGVLLSANVAILGCGSSKGGLGSGGTDGGASQGGTGRGGSGTGGNQETGGSGGSTGPGGEGGRSALGSGGSAADGGSTGAGGALGSGGKSGTGGTQAGGSTSPADGGGATGGHTGSGGSSTGSGGSNTGSGGSSTGGRGGGGAGSGGESASAGGIRAGGAAGGGTTGSGRGGTAGSGSGGNGLGGFGGHKSCQSDSDCAGFKCCNSLCSNIQNDILNCGACGTICSGADSYCNGGRCTAPPCQNTTCGAGTSCCGTQCCGAGQICCSVTLGPSMIGCFDPVDGTCPTGCADCVCAAPSTPIATPQGERPIAELRVGDWVYSVDRGQVRPVPIKRINRQAVSPSHLMVALRLASGRTLLVSPLHPTADGRTFRDLARGDELDGVAIVEARTVTYDQAFTYDILPDSDSGAYFAGSVLIGSTLATSEANPLVSAAFPAPASFLR